VASCTCSLRGERNLKKLFDTYLSNRAIASNFLKCLLCAVLVTWIIRSKTRPVRWRKFFIPCLPT
jgi:hypothetical protein